MGGGIGGLTAAVALARQGLAAEVYEQAPDLAEVGAGVGLWPNAMTALEPIGLAGKVARLAVPVPRHGVRRSDGTWLMSFPGELMVERWGAGLALVHRAELQQLLAAELDPSAIHLGARCTGVEDGDRAVTARFSDGRVARADVLVGADGVHSAVRAALFRPAPLRYRGYITVRGVTVAGSVPPPVDGAETWGRGARFGLGPTSGNRIIWWATWKEAAGGQNDGETAARMLELFGSWHDPIPAIIDASPKTAVIRKDIYDRRPTRTWSRGRVALLGDAIHPMTPDLGQGASQAIVDATTLAACLAASRDSRAALREYQQRRWRNAAINTLMARTFGTMGLWDGRIACAARNSLARVMPLSLHLRQFDLVLGDTRPASIEGSRSRGRRPIAD
ncbi:MAG TPA: FAD-dependent monooxygenase [Streptosporangiaceae bacterium]|nr:FAD-dependent monooxygenase [Streptosporangiaceae bacterium]